MAEDAQVRSTAPTGHDCSLALRRQLHKHGSCSCSAAAIPYFYAAADAWLGCTGGDSGAEGRGRGAEAGWCCRCRCVELEPDRGRRRRPHGPIRCKHSPNARALARQWNLETRAAASRCKRAVCWSRGPVQSAAASKRGVAQGS